MGGVGEAGSVRSVVRHLCSAIRSGGFWCASAALGGWRGGCPAVEVVEDPANEVDTWAWYEGSRTGEEALRAEQNVGGAVVVRGMSWG